MNKVVTVQHRDLGKNTLLEPNHNLIGWCSLTVASLRLPVGNILLFSGSPELPLAAMIKDE